MQETLSRPVGAFWVPLKRDLVLVVTVDLRQDVGSSVHVQGLIFGSFLKLGIEWPQEYPLWNRQVQWLLDGTWGWGKLAMPSRTTTTKRIWALVPSTMHSVGQLASCWETLGPDRQWPSIDIRTLLPPPASCPSSVFVCLFVFLFDFFSWKKTWSSIKWDARGNKLLRSLCDRLQSQGSQSWLINVLWTLWHLSNQFQTQPDKRGFKRTLPQHLNPFLARTGRTELLCFYTE